MSNSAEPPRFTTILYFPYRTQRGAAVATLADGVAVAAGVDHARVVRITGRTADVGSDGPDKDRVGAVGHIRPVLSPHSAPTPPIDFHVICRYKTVKW